MFGLRKEIRELGITARQTGRVDAARVAVDYVQRLIKQNPSPGFVLTREFMTVNALADLLCALAVEEQKP